MEKDIKLLLAFKYGEYADTKWDYPQECERCVSEWRKNAGWLKDIDIKIYSNVEITELPSGVEYVYTDFMRPRNAPRLKYDYDSVHLAGLQAHQDFPEATFVHIDLDMCILRELPKDLFDHETVMGVYSFLDNPRPKLYGDLLAESDFIITAPSSTFYQDFFNLGNVALRAKRVCQCDYWAEEYICDYLLNTKGYHTFKDYEYGQGFAGKPKDPYFWHQHIVGQGVFGASAQQSIIV